MSDNDAFRMMPRDVAGVCLLVLFMWAVIFAPYMSDDLLTRGRSAPASTSQASR